MEFLKIRTEFRLRAVDITIVIMILYMNFYTLLSNLLHLSNIKMVVPTIFLMSLFSLIVDRKNIVIKKESIKLCACWLIFLVYQVICIKLVGDNGLLMFRQMMYFIIWFILAQIGQWHKKIIVMLASICFINSIATFVFLALPQLYKVMIRIYGRSVSGSSGGRTGYRAALADHYSQNAVFISMAVLAAGCVLIELMLNKKKQKKYLIKYGLLFFLSVIALLLTSKRGPLLFCGVAAVAAFFISEHKNLGKKIFVFIGICAIAVISFVVLSNYIPELSAIVERFSNSKEDESTKERMEMWNLAIRMFKEHPLFGNGTYSYRIQYEQYFGNRFQSAGNEAYQKFLNTHNVFLQVLSENGIFGILLFAGAYLQMFFNSVRTYFFVKNVESDYRIIAAQLFSVAIQIYFLFYCITGNPMYDIFYSYYCCSIGITLSLSNQYAFYFKINRKTLKKPAVQHLFKALSQ